MPQLDKLSFIPQLLWFFSVFFLVYIFLSQSVLPSLAYSLKLRSRVMEKFEASKSKSSFDEDFDTLVSSLQNTIDSTKNLNNTAIASVNEENNYILNEVPDLLFKEGEEFKTIKALYIQEIFQLKLKQAVSTKIVEREFNKQ